MNDYIIEMQKHIYVGLYMKTLVPEAGDRLNKKDGLTRYGDFHVKDKTS